MHVKHVPARRAHRRCFYSHATVTAITAISAVSALLLRHTWLKKQEERGRRGGRKVGDGEGEKEEDEIRNPQKVGSHIYCIVNYTHMQSICAHRYTHMHRCTHVSLIVNVPGRCCCCCCCCCCWPIELIPGLCVCVCACVCVCVCVCVWVCLCACVSHQAYAYLNMLKYICWKMYVVLVSCNDICLILSYVSKRAKEKAKERDTQW